MLLNDAALLLSHSPKDSNEPNETHSATLLTLELKRWQYYELEGKEAIVAVTAYSTR